MTDAARQLDPRKIRFGLVLITLVFVAVTVLFFVVDDTIARAIFFAVAVLALVRVISLARWLRRRTRPTA